MQILENISLQAYNTFGIDQKAKYFVVIKTLEEAQKLVKEPIFLNHKRLILGGGSNILLTEDFDGLVIKNEILGIQKTEETTNYTYLQVGAGVSWHEFVLETIQLGLGGAENMSLIPGTVGAAPMQNIGAYGAELKDIFHELEAVEIATGSVHHFDKDTCEFGYRESIFKHQVKDQYLITGVTFKLSKKPQFNTSYGAISDTLQMMQVAELSLKAISDAVIHIRQSKLPDPKKIGNAGSFFKNPSIPASQFEQLKSTHPNIPGYIQEDGTVKVPAAWLIEQTGWKGKTMGAVGVHVNQPLVLVNYGGGKGHEILALSREIQSSVKEQFGVTLNPEVNIY